MGVHRSDSVLAPAQLAHKGVITPLIVVDGKEHRFAIDFSDHAGMHFDQLPEALCYFKMQLRTGSVAPPHVLPGGFVGADLALYRYATRLRQPPQETAVRLYGRFNLALGREPRVRAMNLLHGQDRVPVRVSTETIRYSRYLEEAARSALCLDLPGNGPLCFRLVDYLALGCAVVGPPHDAILPVPLEHGRQILHCATDLSDLVDVSERALSNRELRRRLRVGAAEYFDRYLHHHQLAAYYLHELYKRI